MLIALIILGVGLWLSACLAALAAAARFFVEYNVVVYTFGFFASIAVIVAVNVAILSLFGS